MSGLLAPAAGWPAILARALPFGLYLAFMVLYPVLAPLLPDSRWLYAAQIGTVVLALLLFGRRYVELAGIGAVRGRDWGLAVFVGMVVFVAWINLELPWLSFGDSSGFDPSMAGGGLDARLVVLRLVGAVAVVPVMEELFWRSFVMRWIDRADFPKQTAASLSWRALLLSSIPFGLEHDLWFAGIVAGLAYGWVFRHCGSLWPAIVAHATTNLMLGIWVVGTGHWRFW